MRTVRPRRRRARTWACWPDAEPVRPVRTATNVAPNQSSSARPSRSRTGAAQAVRAGAGIAGLLARRVVGAASERFIRYDPDGSSRDPHEEFRWLDVTAHVDVRTRSRDGRGSTSPAPTPPGSRCGRHSSPRTAGARATARSGEPAPRPVGRLRPPRGDRRRAPPAAPHAAPVGRVRRRGRHADGVRPRPRWVTAPLGHRGRPPRQEVACAAASAGGDHRQHAAPRRHRPLSSPRPAPSAPSSPAPWPDPSTSSLVAAPPTGEVVDGGFSAVDDSRCGCACCPCPSTRSSPPGSGRPRRCERTWVPPSACLSSPTMSTTRISVTDSGMRFTFVRIRSSSATASSAGRNDDLDRPVGRQLGVHELLDPWRRSPGQRVELEVHPGRQRLHVPAGDRRAPLVPDHAAQHVQGGVGAHQRVAAVPVDLAVDGRPRGGGSPSSVCHTPVTLLADSTTGARPPSSVPVSWGWPPPVG